MSRHLNWQVLWTQAMWQTEECNMISKAMHYLDWEKVWQLFGPNIYIISRTRTHMNEIWTQVLVTRRTYTSLMKLDLHTHGSALLLGQHGRILNAVSYQQATHTVTHFTQIALEDLHGDGRWFYDDSIEHSPHLPRPNRFNDGQQDEEVSQPKCAETSTDAANLHSLLQTKKLPESHDKNLLGSLTKLGIGHRGTSRSKPQPKDSKPLVNDSSVATGAIEGNIETEDSDEVSVHSDAISSASFQMSEEDESTQTDSDQESIYSDAISSDSFQMCEEDEEELDFSKRIVIKFVDNLFNDGEVGELREELVRSNQFIMEDSITSCKVVLSRIIIGFSSISVLNEVLTKGVEIFGVSFPPSSMRLVDDLDSEEMGSAVIRPDSWSVWNNPEVSPKLYLVTEMNEDVGKPDVLGLTDIDASLLPCPQYLPLERLSRCVHLEDAIEIITEEHLPSSTIASNRKKEVADIKVLWCQGMWPVRRHNMFGNVSFYLDWEEVLERFGPNIYCLNIGRTQKDEIRTQLLVTRKTYTTLQKLDLHTHGSALLLGTDGRMLRAVSYQQGSHTVTHITQIALEDLDDDGRWFYASCDKMCNDHMTKEHHFCFKYNIMRKKKPCPSPLKAGDTWMLLESWLGPEEMARVFETKL
ncbi:uncharacterized protein LOC108664709 [Hyalella azteca]|uniref:Uncharacterized protein LOC108664709 n=1 Tax=Hyalella azteca TaxID=294128 RepID=A0A979FKE0_HYAAZ|nr:uncharacterized protein LOC108664709 [Hyalella azteca]